MPGEKYLYEAGVGEDGFVTFKTCQHCMVCRDLVLKKCHGFVYGEILQDLYDHTWPGIPWRGVAARMYIGMRRKWQKFLNPELMPLPQGDA